MTSNFKNKNSLLMILISLCCSVGIAQSPKPDVMACTMFDGYLTHKLSGNAVEGFELYLSFPIYRENLVGEELEKKKQEWAEWDGVSPQPEDTRKLAIATPLTSSNVMSFDVQRLETRKKFFEKLFPPIEASPVIPFATGKLLVHFSGNQCDIVRKDSLISAFCENSAAVKINGVVVDRIFLMMSNSTKAQLVRPEGGGDPQVEMVNEVTAEVTFLYQNRQYRSSFTYKPNGNDRQCHFDGDAII